MKTNWAMVIGGCLGGMIACMIGIHIGENRTAIHACKWFQQGLTTTQQELCIEELTAGRDWRVLRDKLNEDAP